MQRFLPSEFGTDPARMQHALAPGRVMFDDKMLVRKAIQDAGIPYTYVSANCFAGYFLGGLCQPGHILPSKDSVLLLGDGNKKGALLIIKVKCLIYLKWGGLKIIYIYIYIYIKFMRNCILNLGYSYIGSNIRG